MTVCGAYGYDRASFAYRKDFAHGRYGGNLIIRGLICKYSVAPGVYLRLKISILADGKLIAVLYLYALAGRGSICRLNLNVYGLLHGSALRKYRYLCFSYTLRTDFAVVYRSHIRIVRLIKNDVVVFSRSLGHFERNLATDLKL